MHKHEHFTAARATHQLNLGNNSGNTQTCNHIITTATKQFEFKPKVSNSELTATCILSNSDN